MHHDSSSDAWKQEHNTGSRPPAAAVTGGHGSRLLTQEGCRKGCLYARLSTLVLLGLPAAAACNLRCSTSSATMMVNWHYSYAVQAIQYWYIPVGRRCSIRQGFVLKMGPLESPVSSPFGVVDKSA